MPPRWRPFLPRFGNGGGRPAAGSDGRRVLEFVAALYKSATIGLGVRRGEIGPWDAFYRSMAGD